MTFEPLHPSATTPPLRHPRRILPGEIHPRADAITAGVLVEVPGPLIALYGLPWPVAVTARAWLDTIAWPSSSPEQHHQPQPYESEEGRLLDLLWMVKTAHETGRPQRHRGSGRRYPLTLWGVPAPAPSRKAQPVRLILTVHTGDHGEPVAILAHQDHRPRCWQRHHYTAALVLLAATVVVVMFAR